MVYRLVWLKLVAKVRFLATFTRTFSAMQVALPCVHKGHQTRIKRLRSRPVPPSFQNAQFALFLSPRLPCSSAPIADNTNGFIIHTNVILDDTNSRFGHQTTAKYRLICLSKDLCSSNRQGQSTRILLQLSHDNWKIFWIRVSQGSYAFINYAVIVFQYL